VARGRAKRCPFEPIVPKKNNKHIERVLKNIGTIINRTNVERAEIV